MLTWTCAAAAIFLAGISFLTTNLDLSPEADQLPYNQLGSVSGSCPHSHSYLATAADYWACFVNCSQAVTNISSYKPVPCLTVNDSFVYVLVSDCPVNSLKPSCGYLAKIPFDDPRSSDLLPEDATYASIIESVTKGFRVNFPSDVYCSSTYRHVNLSRKLRTCLNYTNRFFHEKISGTSPLNWTIAFFWSEIYFAQRFYGYYYNQTTNKLFLVIEVILYAIGVTKLLIGLCSHLW
uniref:Uncharacterized protein n=1 Tax=Setaria viridis TaxID=4556 RepID=A0A4U6UL95_SETVI|nr:hypothetical protein SEVIR_5G205576v2 [Setaria viridis]